MPRTQAFEASARFVYVLRSTLTRRKEKTIHPKKSHLPILKGMVTQPLSECSGQLLKMAFDQESVDNMVTAVKISDM